jgi:hypothetical protein
MGDGVKEGMVIGTVRTVYYCEFKAPKVATLNPKLD